MSAILNHALASLNLQPGQIYRTTVNGREVEVRMLEQKPTEQAAEEEGEIKDWEMVDIFLTMPESPNARVVIPVTGEPMLPPPIIIEESDLAPE